MIKNKAHIKIPWYRRNVRIRETEMVDMPTNNFKIPIPRTPTAVPRTHSQPVRQPATQPALQPSTQPSTQPVREPFRVPEPAPITDPFPFPFPRGQFEPNNPFPIPVPLPLPNPRDSVPQLPTIPRPQPAYSTTTETAKKDNPIVENLKAIVRVVAFLFVANEVKNQWVQANITDPIYGEMMKDPVLGFVLREAEKSNLDMETAANYFANYDYANFDLEQMTKELTTLFGAAAAARLIVFFIGRKVVFRI